MMKKLFALAILALAGAVSPAWGQGANFLPANLYRYAASYVSNTALAANTAGTVFAPASNTKGAVVLCSMNSSYTAPGYVQLVAHTSAPANMTTGDVLAVGQAVTGFSTSFGTSFQMPLPVFIPAGKGLYSISSAAEATTARSCLYTLLQ
jgi:hypothetical protein